MRKIIILVGLGFVVSQLYAQKIKESEVPVVVKTAFTKAHKSAKEVTWERAGDSFEVEFVEDKMEFSNVFDATGTLLEEETEIAMDELSPVITSKVAKDYAGFKITEVAKIRAKKTITYELEIEKGTERYDLIFDDQGKLLKKITKEKEEEDKD